MISIYYFPKIDYNHLYRRGIELIEYEDGPTIAWPRCEITDCTNGICVGLSNSLCYPHGIEFKAFTKNEFEANRKKRHNLK